MGSLQGATPHHTTTHHMKSNHSKSHTYNTTPYLIIPLLTRPQPHHNASQDTTLHRSAPHHLRPSRYLVEWSRAMIGKKIPISHLTLMDQMQMQLKCLIPIHDMSRFNSRTIGIVRQQCFWVLQISPSARMGGPLFGPDINDG